MTGPGPPGEPAELNAAQADVLARLGARVEERPHFPADLRARLRDDIEDELLPVLAMLPEGETVAVSKHALATVHSCEARWQAEAARPDFALSPPIVRGSVAHRAIELALNRREPAPATELVDSAIDRLADDDAWMSEWLRTCDEDDRAEVRSAAVAQVAAFQECWPPLKRTWAPVTEQALRAELAGGRILLRGRVDLALGRADGTRAGKVIVDFKTGGFAVHHLDDLRFYALIEALRLGVPPRALATSYLESGRLHVEPVTVALLEATAARTVDGIARMMAVTHGGEDANRTPSGACRWCPALPDCEPGQTHLAERNAEVP